MKQYELVNSMGNHGAAGYLQNAGVLVVLISAKASLISCNNLSAQLTRSVKYIDKKKTKKNA